MNKSVSQFRFKLIITMLFSCGSGQQHRNNNKNAGKLLAISIAMAMQQYDVGCIAQWSTSRASLEATRCRNW